MKLRKLFKRQNDFNKDKSKDRPKEEEVSTQDNEIQPAPEDTPMPRIRDMYGNILDPNSWWKMPQVVPEGQGEPDSIFYVPPPPKPQEPMKKGEDINDLIAQMRRQGFAGENIVICSPVTTEDTENYRKERQKVNQTLPHTDKNYRISDLEKPTCPYCTNILRGGEDREGFVLQELYEVAKSGCETCDVLQQAITYFAKLVFLDFDMNQTFVKQTATGSGRLLSEAKDVEVCFEDHHKETLNLTFKAVEESDLDGGIPVGRVQDTSSREAAFLMQYWLQDCIQNHESCNSRVEMGSPKRLLEVKDGFVRVVERQDNPPYLTLSHCWGKPTWTALTSVNLPALKHEVPWESLTQTFRDALTLTERLGFHHLWIDGFCILQDSKQDWLDHVSKMAQIFQNSVLIIAASRARDGHEGCFSRHSNRIMDLGGQSGRKMKNSLLWRSQILEGRDRDGILKTFVAQIKTPHGLYTGVTPREPLLQRAWVFQEQILSPRILHFGTGELYFECKSSVVCECSKSSLRSLSTQWETRWRKAHEILMVTPPAISNNKDALMNANRHYEAYRALVETYTDLDITVESDRLPALSGVNYGRQGSDMYLAGMWRSILLYSLHWTALPQGKQYMTKRPFEYRGPSWSWVAVEGPVRHVETDFYRTGHSSKLEAQIIDVSCTPEGTDPRGRVVDGFLRIKGLITILTVSEVGFRQRDVSFKGLLDGREEKLAETGLRPSTWLRASTYAMLTDGTNSEHCWLDAPLALCLTEPSEINVGDKVTCLQISTRTLLVLKPIPNAAQEFTRIGIFRPNEKGWRLYDYRKPLTIW